MTPACGMSSDDPVTTVAEMFRILPLIPVGLHLVEVSDVGKFRIPLWIFGHSERCWCHSIGMVKSERTAPIMQKRRHVSVGRRMQRIGSHSWSWKTLSALLYSSMTRTQACVILKAERGWLLIVCETTEDHQYLLSRNRLILKYCVPSSP